VGAIVVAGLVSVVRRLGRALATVGLRPVAPRLDLAYATIKLIAVLAGWLASWLAAGRHLTIGRPQ